MADRFTVVVVDDHTMVAESLRRMLDAEDDLEVVEVAESRAGGLDAVRRLAPTVAIVDYNLPDGNGAQLTAEIKALRPATEVVLLTGGADESALLEAVRAGCTGIVMKDAALKDLVHAVRTSCRGGATVSSALLGQLIASRPEPAKWDLTPRELEVLQALAGGRSNAQIGTELVLSASTVRNHIQSVLNKLGVHSKLEAVVLAVREGIVGIGGKSTD